MKEKEKTRTEFNNRRLRVDANGDPLFDNGPSGGGVGGGTAASGMVDGGGKGVGGGCSPGRPPDP